MNMAEEWRSTPGWEGRYEVSNYGRVRRLKRVVTNSNGFACTLPAMEMKLRPSNMGRLTVGLTRDKRQSSVFVHSLVLTAFVCPRPEGLLACHNDGDHLNNYVGNLRWDTSTENNRDTVRHGKHRWSGRERCARKHLLTGANLYRRRTENANRCRACVKGHQYVNYHHQQWRIEEVSDHYYAQLMHGAPSSPPRALQSLKNAG